MIKGKKMKFKSIFITLTMIGMIFAGTASADTIGNTIMTGYTYMGGQGSYSTYPDDSKDYFIASCLEVFGRDGIEDMWGYGWAKFSVSATETVESAYLVIDLLGTGSMGGANPAATTEDLPAYLDVYDPGAVDVATLTAGGDNPNVADLKDTLLDQTPVSSLTMTANGTYSLDITDLYNSWVLDPDSNNGIVLASGYVYDGWIEPLTQEFYDSLQDDEELATAYATELFATAAKCGSVYASFDRDGATAPYISTSAVPVPAALWLLGSGLLGLVGLRRRKG
jgi:hypothetical protein